MQPPTTLLIVDDDVALCAAYAAVLQTSGYTTLCANTADQALRILAEHKEVAIVMTDLHLPQVSGLALLSQIKAAGHSVPSLLFTGAGEFTHASARAAGVSAFLVKPIASPELLRVVSAVLVQNDLAR